jgi:hypothetical protein
MTVFLHARHCPPHSHSHIFSQQKPTWSSPDLFLQTSAKRLRWQLSAVLLENSACFLTSASTVTKTLRLQVSEMRCSCPCVSTCSGTTYGVRPCTVETSCFSLRACDLEEEIKFSSPGFYSKIHVSVNERWESEVIRVHGQRKGVQCGRVHQSDYD